MRTPSAKYKSDHSPAALPRAPPSALAGIIAPNDEVPVDVIAPQPIVPIVAIFLSPSKTTALLAVAVPAVTLSKTPISAVVIVVESNVILVSQIIAPVTFKLVPS